MYSPCIRFSSFRSVLRISSCRFLSNNEVEQKIGENRNPKIIKLDFKDKTLSNAVLKVKSSKMRDKHNLILIEGGRLLKDLMSSGYKPSMVFFSQPKDIQGLHFDHSTILYKTPYKDLQLWSNLTTSPGILAICEKPVAVQPNDNHLPITLVCDQIREPGNLGAIFRTAAGAGIKQIILTKGCVDLWDPKVLRSGSGAHFRIPIYSDVTWQEISDQMVQKSLVLLASNRANNLGDNSNFKNIPIKKYFEISCHSYSNIIIVIGGETEGLSENAYDFTFNFNGFRLNIPLENNVESLNAASACSVILFEIKKQLQNDLKT